jgi:hypothetical protein
MPDRRWNLADTELGARSHAALDGELAAQLPRRGTAEVRRLREVSHTYHLSQATGVTVVPRDNMGALLERLKGQLICARCGASY